CSRHSGPRVAAVRRVANGPGDLRGRDRAAVPGGARGVRDSGVARRARGPRPGPAGRVTARPEVGPLRHPARRCSPRSAMAPLPAPSLTRRIAQIGARYGPARLSNPRDFPYVTIMEQRPANPPAPADDQALVDAFEARIAAGESIEPKDWMPERYRKQLTRMMSQHAHSEI